MVIDSMKNNRNIIIPRKDIIISRSDFIIQCSIVKHNSNVSGPWMDGVLDPINNRTLRFVSQANLEKYSHNQPVHVSFENDLFYVPVIEEENSLDNQKDCESTKFRIRVFAVETMKSINIDGWINLTLHFTTDTGSEVSTDRRSTVSKRTIEGDTSRTEGLPLVTTTAD